MGFSIEIPLGRSRGPWLFVVVPTLMLCVALIETVSNLQVFSQYAETTGVVTAFTPPDRYAKDKQLRAGRVAFTYTIRQVEYRGVYPPEYWMTMPRAEYQVLLHPPAVGDAITVYYSSANPSLCTLERRIEPFPLCMAGFLAPFIVWGVKLMMRPANDDRETMGDVFTVWHFVLSALGSFGIAMASNALGWPNAVVAALIVPVAAPALSWLIARRASPTADELPYTPPPGTRQARKAARRAAREAARAEGRRQSLGLVGATLFWWGVLSPFLYFLGVAWLESFAADRYQTTDGRIVESRVEHDDKSTRPVVLYTYAVDGRTYRGDRITFGQNNVGMPENDSQAVCAAYRCHKRVTVYYDPADPRRAVLDTRFWAHYVFLTYALSVFVVVGLFLLFHIIGGAPEHSERFGRIATGYFGAHVLSLIVLGTAGAYRPDRAELTWFGLAAIGIGMVLGAVWPVPGRR